MTSFRLREADSELGILTYNVMQKTTGRHTKSKRKVPVDKKKRRSNGGIQLND